MPRFVYISLFLLLAHGANAFTFSRITKTETQQIIDSLCKSNYRTIEKKMLTDSFLFRERVYADLYGIHYCRYFYPSGKLRSEGLCDYRGRGEGFMDADRQWEGDALLETSRIGTWTYYDKDGKVYMEYDFSANKEKTISSKQNATAADFEKVKKSAADFFISHFGEKFYKEHVRISPFISWEPAGRKGGEQYVFYPVNFESEDYELCWPDLPLKHASGYRAEVTFFFEDTIAVYHEIMHFDSTCKPTTIGYYSVDEYKRDQCVKMSYREALDSAEGNGFNGPLEFDWNKYGCHWTTGHAKDPESDYCFRMDVCTGSFYTNMVRDLSQRLIEKAKMCETKFTADCPAAGAVSAGWKRLDYGDFEIDVPLGWIRTDIRHSSHKEETILSNGTDTLIIGPLCYDFALYDYFREEYDRKTVEKFDSLFPGYKMQGRNMSLRILIRDGFYDINLELNESGNLTYSFTSKAKTAEGRDEVMEILKTIRFKKCG